MVPWFALFLGRQGLEPVGKEHRDNGYAQGFVVDVKLGVYAFGLEFIQDCVELVLALEGASAHKDGVGVLEFHMGALGHFHKFVKGPQDMGPSKERIVKGHGRFGPGMHCEGPVVFFGQKRDVTGFGDARETPGKVHHAKGKAAGAFLEALLKKGQHLFALSFSEGAVVPAGHACACGAVADDYGFVAGILAVHRLKETLYRRINAGCVSPIAEKAGSHFVHIRGFLAETNGRKTAVARNERGDTLADKRLEVLQRLFFDGKPVVVGVGVKKAGGYAKALKVYNFIGLFLKALPHGGNLFIFYKDVSCYGGGTCAVIDFPVLEKDTHNKVWFSFVCRCKNTKNLLKNTIFVVYEGIPQNDEAIRLPL